MGIVQPMDFRVADAVAGAGLMPAVGGKLGANERHVPGVEDGRGGEI